MPVMKPLRAALLSVVFRFRVLPPKWRYSSIAGAVVVLVLALWIGFAGGAHNAVLQAQAAASGGTTKPPLLEFDSQRSGNVLEIRGTTECGASVMINGDPAPLIFDHCGFKHFMVVPEGKVLVTITSMNARGGVNTQQLTVE